MRTKFQGLILRQSVGNRSRSRQFHAHDAIPETGIYRVTHGAHRLPHEVTLIKAELFPPCSNCSGEVLFEMLHAAPSLEEAVPHLSFRVALYQLPVLEDEEEMTGAS